MRRRDCLLLPLAAASAAAQGKDTVRGRLIQDESRPPAIRSADGSVVRLHGDRETIGVLRDGRLADDDFEAVGSRRNDGGFDVDPIHLRALFVHRNGKRLVITYWCAVCSIRTFTPGRCVCCQEETSLDPRDPALKDTDPSFD